MNLGEIEGSIYDTLGHNSTPDGSITRRIRRDINNIHRQLLGMRGMTRLRRKTLPFTCVANDGLCVLPQAAVHIAVIVDRTNRQTLDCVSVQQLRARDPGNSFTSSIPDSYCIINMAAAVAKDPSTADQLFIISDSASDSNGISVFIEGTITGGYQRRSSVAMNGLTAVAIDSNVTWEHITKFYLSSACKGSVTLHQTSGVGTELARITEGHSSARYTQIELQGIPGSAITYYADVELRVENMTSTTDEPLIPEDFHYVIEAGVLMREYVKREKPALWKIERERWMMGLSDLKAWMNRKPDVPSAMGRGFSQLGPMFPAGS